MYQPVDFPSHQSGPIVISQSHTQVPVYYAQAQKAYHQQLLSQLLPTSQTIGGDSFDCEAQTPSYESSDRESASYSSSLNSPIEPTEMLFDASVLGPGQLDMYPSQVVTEQTLKMQSVNEQDPSYGLSYHLNSLAQPLWDPAFYPLSQQQAMSGDLNFPTQPLQPSPPMNFQPDLLGIVGGPFLGPDSHASTITSFNAPAVINPDWLKTETVTDPSAENSPDYPASPLRSISHSSASSPSVPPDTHREKRARRFSEADHPALLVGGSKHKRKMTWSAGTISEEAELGDEELKELEEFDARQGVSGPNTRRDRRRLQNRLAQRAFRARSKIHHREAAEHLTHLEQLTKSQSARLEELTALVERLQRENTLLKTERWSEVQARAGGEGRG